MLRRSFVLLLLVLFPAAARAGLDRSGQDVSKQNFASQALVEANFEDAVCQNTNFSKAQLAKANFQGADLTYCNMAYADLTGADFRNAKLEYTSFYMSDTSKANFEGCNFTNLTISYAKFREVNMRNLKGIGNVLEVDFYKADLRGANLAGMADSTKRCSFRKAIYDKNTRWPAGFNIEASGAVLVETPDEPVKPVVSDKSIAQSFAKLDVNEDGRLSGSEMKGLELLDTDKNGRITFEEFAAGTKKGE